MSGAGKCDSMVGQEIARSRGQASGNTQVPVPMATSLWLLWRSVDQVFEYAIIKKTDNLLGMSNCFRNFVAD